MKEKDNIYSQGHYKAQHCINKQTITIISAFETNFLNQGVLQNLKHQNSCTCVYKSAFWEKLRLVSFKNSFHMPLYLFICCVPRVTQLRCSSLHLNTLNQF